MSRFTYECKECKSRTIIKSYDEFINFCYKCNKENTLFRIYDIPNISTIKYSENRKRKIGDVTKEFIEDSKKELIEQKKDLEEKRNK